MTSWVCVKLWDHTYVLRCCVYWVVSYEPYNQTTVRAFKSYELMRDEYCDGFHCGNSTSLITLRHDELKYFENNWGVLCFVQFIDRVCVLKYFLGWSWINRERPWRTLQNVGLGGKYTRFEYSLKIMLISYSLSVLAK